MAPQPAAIAARLVVLLVTAALLCTLPFVAGRPLGPRDARADDLVSPEVRNELASNGRARVIVEVQLPVAFVPEGLFRIPAHVTAQRASVAAVQSQVLARLQGRGHTVLHRFETVPYLLLDVLPDALAELEASSFYVRRVVDDKVHEPLLPQSVPLVQGPAAWTQGFDGTGTVIAILDTGVDKTHPFLAGKVIEEACYSTSTFLQSTTLCPNGLSEQTGPGAGVNCPTNIPLCFHGTHMAGIAAGRGVSFSGVARGAQIMSVQVFSRGINPSLCGAPQCLMVYTSDIMKGLERVYSLRDQHPFSAVNLSVGGGIYSSNCDGDPAKPVIDNLRSVGIATVIASGNNSFVNRMNGPACVSSAVSVASTDKADLVSAFSNVAPFLTLFAPGDPIQSSVPGGSFDIHSGTSMAAPHVSGAFAILKQAYPGASVDTLLGALEQTGLPITDDRPGSGTTKPRIRIADALAILPPPAPPRTLTVVSTNPASGVAVTVSPLDAGGQGSGVTQFDRIYGLNALVTLTAAATAGGNTFQKWQRDGVDFSSSQSVQVAVDADRTLRAVYAFASFVDAPANHPFWPWIEALFRAAITGGCGTNPPTFCPDQNVSRAEMAVFLLRGSHGAGYTPPAATGVFDDVPANAPLAAWIERLFAEGITSGCTTNPLGYCPGQSVTRDQMAILLLRAKHGAEYQPPAATGLFADVPANHPLAPWIEQLFAEGITTGCGTNPRRYCPTQSVTRGEMAVFLVRAFNLPL